MIISNLSYLEDISEPPSIMGGASCSVELIVGNGKVVRNTKSGDCSNVNTATTSSTTSVSNSSLSDSPLYNEACSFGGTF